MAFDKNRALDGDRYNNGPTALRVEHLRGSNATVLTVTDVDEASFTDPDAPSGKRHVLVLKSAEFPDRGFFLNKTGRTIMTERFTEVPARWIGKKVPLVVVQAENPKKGNAVQPSLQVATDEDWDAVLESVGIRKPGRPAAKRGAQKKTGKRR